MSQNTLTVINTIIRILGQRAFDYVDESVCQEQIENHLKELNTLFEREFQLDKYSRIDFYFPRSKIGLEVKAGKVWSKKEVFRQLERYAQYENVSGIILATGRMQGLPPVINQKPIRIFSLGAAHL